MPWTKTQMAHRIRNTVRPREFISSSCITSAPFTSSSFSRPRPHRSVPIVFKTSLYPHDLIEPLIISPQLRHSTRTAIRSTSSTATSGRILPHSGVSFIPRVRGAAHEAPASSLLPVSSQNLLSQILAPSSFHRYFLIPRSLYHHV